MTVVGQVEIDPFCQRVLARHWPEVPRHDDVRTCVDWWGGSESRPAVHVVAGGFPCQPFSTAGRQRGVADERWGWPWFADVVRALRPQFVVVENVAALLANRDAFGGILADLAAGGYDAEWDCVPAAAVGAAHRRDRVFLVAYPECAGLRDESVAESGGIRSAVVRDDGAPRHVADPDSEVGRSAARRTLADAGGASVLGAGTQEPRRRGGDVADADDERLEGCGLPEARRGTSCADVGRRGPVVFGRGVRPGGEWAAEPDVGRVAHGVPGRVDRLRGLGNAVVPQVAEHIGQLVMVAARSAVAA